MSDVERITEMNHRRAKAAEGRMRWEEMVRREARRMERREKLQRAILSGFWTIGAMLSGAALVVLYLGLTGSALALGAGSLAAVLGGRLYEG